MYVYHEKLIFEENSTRSVHLHTTLSMKASFYLAMISNHTQVPLLISKGSEKNFQITQWWRWICISTTERNLKPMENMAANQEIVYVHRPKSLYAVMPPPPWLTIEFCQVVYSTRNNARLPGCTGCINLISWKWNVIWHE